MKDNIGKCHLSLSSGKTERIKFENSANFNHIGT